jgi:hypothetical protein
MIDPRHIAIEVRRMKKNWGLSNSDFKEVLSRTVQFTNEPQDWKRIQDLATMVGFKFQLKETEEDVDMNYYVTEFLDVTGMTKTDLALLAGISRVALQDVMEGRARLDTLNAVCSVIGQEIQMVFDFSNIYSKIEQYEKANINKCNPVFITNILHLSDWHDGISEMEPVPDGVPDRRGSLSYRSRFNSSSWA